MKHLNPGTPAWARAGSSAAFPRTTPPQAAQSTHALPRAAERLASRAATFDGFWHAVKRHVDEGGDSAGGCSARSGVEALPVASGIVDVDVRVDEAREHEQVAKVVAFPGTAGIAPGADCGDLLAVHHERGGSQAFGRENAS